MGASSAPPSGACLACGTSHPHASGLHRRHVLPRRLRRDATHLNQPAHEAEHHQLLPQLRVERRVRPQHSPRVLTEPAADEQDPPPHARRRVTAHAVVIRRVDVLADGLVKLGHPTTLDARHLARQKPCAGGHTPAGTEHGTAVSPRASTWLKNSARPPALESRNVPSDTAIAKSSFRRKFALATRNMQCSHCRPCGKQHAAKSSRR
mmetsp:Transcript_23113/g.54996  ORF Transcript_23113/g.54996 Transcript_23113/m.54996 type:complete len:207 (-) Transcript_23113:2558-3178(-)